jgi:exosortase K
MNTKLKTLAQLTAILLTAYALKSSYSTSRVNDLHWILAPTTFLVQLITGDQFTFESHAGYMSSDHAFLIAASCSGVNFLLISFLVLTLGTLWRERTTNWTFLPIAALVAYSTTLIANTARIVIAMQMHASNFRLAGFDSEELHRIEGIAVYFLFLLLLFLTAEKFSMAAITSRTKYLLIIYYGVTIGIPLVRGSFRDPAFWQHTWFVVLIPLVIIGAFAASCYVCRSTVRAEHS